MHPLLKRNAATRHGTINRLGLYLLAWTPPAVLLIYLLAVPGRIGWRDATVLVIPLCLVYAFVSLSAWYSCKATPIAKASTQRIFLTHTVAILIVSLLWIQIAKLMAYGLSQFTAFHGLDQRLSPQIPVLFGAGCLLYGLAIASNYLILALEDAQAAQARALETSILAREAELKALKAQINPHFLFNSLNSISALTSKDPDKAQEMCILLADFLRMTLGLGEKTQVSLREEMDLLQRFLSIEKVRFGERLRLEVHVGANAETCLLPPLILQPLAENAVVHGIANLPDGGSLRITAECDQERLNVVVENSVDPDAAPPRKGGLGLNNVRQRLETRYGNEAAITVTAGEDIFRVTLALPVETSAKTEPVAAEELHQVKEVRA